MRSAGPSTSAWVLQPTSVEGAWNPGGLATQQNEGHRRLHRNAARAHGPPRMGFLQPSVAGAGLWDSLDFRTGSPEDSHKEGPSLSQT